MRYKGMYNKVYNQIYFNSDTTNSNYRYRDIYGTGSAAGSEAGAAATVSVGVISAGAAVSAV